jgi:glycerol kinase
MDKRWEPRWTAGERDSAYAGWQKAVERTFGWVST